tara:strand:- start:357 stop:689 length:333 start_codon:yes stop_codon:yes gene_type:complete
MEFSDLNKNTSVTRTADILPPSSSNYATLPQSSRTAIYPLSNAQKPAHPTENNSRIFSPYSSPSAINVENKALAQASGGPVYQHNIAMTKYYHISITPKPRTNQSMNILA